MSSFFTLLADQFSNFVSGERDPSLLPVSENDGLSRPTTNDQGQQSEFLSVSATTASTAQTKTQNQVLNEHESYDHDHNQPRLGYEPPVSERDPGDREQGLTG